MEVVGLTDQESVAVLQVDTGASSSGIANLLYYLREEFDVVLEHDSGNSRFYSVTTTEDTQPWVRIGEQLSAPIATDGGVDRGGDR